MRDIDRARQRIFTVARKYRGNSIFQIKNFPFLTHVYAVQDGLFIKTLYLLRKKYGRVKPGQKLVSCGMLTDSFHITYFPVSDFLTDAEKTALREMINAGIFKRDYMVKLMDTRRGMNAECNFGTGINTQKEMDSFAYGMLKLVCRQAGDFPYEI